MLGFELLLLVESSLPEEVNRRGSSRFCCTCGYMQWSPCPTVFPPYWSASHGPSMMAYCLWVQCHATRGWQVLGGGRSSNIWHIRHSKGCILTVPPICLLCSRLKSRQNGQRGTDCCVPWSLCHQVPLEVGKHPKQVLQLTLHIEDVPGSYGTCNLPIHVLQAH